MIIETMKLFRNVIIIMTSNLGSDLLLENKREDVEKILNEWQSIGIISE